MQVVDQLKRDLRSLGIKEGDSLMMHCSYKSLGVDIPAEVFFDALMEVLGEEGTLILPAFSYGTVTYDNPFFDRKQTPSCVGFLPEYFRTKVPDVLRSLHATHSCTVKGRLGSFFIKDHELDLTPVGENSPIAKLPKVRGKILLLGSPIDRNTALHGVEEKAKVPYIFDPNKTIHYVLNDGERIIEQEALRHDFKKAHFYYEQKYGRIIDLLSEEECSFGKVLQADCYLMSAQAVWEKGVQKIKEEPYYFVNKATYNCDFPLHGSF